MPSLNRNISHYGVARNEAVWTCGTGGVFDLVLGDQEIVQVKWSNGGQMGSDSN